MALSQQNKRPILLGQDSNSLVWLIVINAVVFVIVGFIKIVYFLSYSDHALAATLFNSQVLDNIQLPGKIGEVVFKPWTVLSYMFTQDSVWTLISNMLWLWAFGYILQDLAGSKKVIPIYIYSGLIGAIFFITTSSFIPVLAGAMFLIGANTAVIGIATAATTLAPNYKIFPMLFGGIPLWVLLTIFILLDIVFVSGSGGNVIISHIAAALMGVVFVKQLRGGQDHGQWMHGVSEWVSGLFDPNKSKPSQKRRRRNVLTTNQQIKTKSPQQRVDEILDKISQRGYDHLSEEEKSFLRKVSEEK